MSGKDDSNKKNDDRSNEQDLNKSRLSLEKKLEQIRRMMQSQKFSSGEQARDFIDKMLNTDPAMPEMPAETPLDKAQELIYKAWEARTRKECISLAREALKISPDCADAYVILAEEYATSLGEALCYYRAGVAAGERAIGAKNFQAYAGHFWGELDTRPYMRAKAGLAECLWEMGKQTEAITHYQEMLKLNPHDNQGTRYILAACLLKMGDIANLKRLLNRYHEDSSAWQYTHALILFMERGDSPEARLALQIASRNNHYVIPYLTGQKQLPRQLPETIGIRDRNEAIYYAAEFGPGWMETPGAVDWLKQQVLAEKPVNKSKLKGIPEVFLEAFDNENAAKPSGPAAETVYTFRVGLRFCPGVWRKIDIRGSQTLHNLHKAIVSAFQRDDDHLYAFYMSNKIWDASSEYGIPVAGSACRDAKKARIDSLGLIPRSKFLYLFDFGDQWEHPVTLLKIRQEAPQGNYPRIVERKGKAPPQYDDTDMA